jgi:hypothetical protein
MTFSLRSFLLAVPVISLGVCGIVFALPWAASLTYTICMTVLLFAFVAAVFARDVRRLYWIGFLVFGWGYWFLAFERVQDYQPSPRAALRFITSDIVDMAERIGVAANLDRGRALVERDEIYWPATIIERKGNTYWVDWDHDRGRYRVDASRVRSFAPSSRQAAHSLLRLSFAIVGAGIAVWLLHDRRECRPTQTAQQ